MDSIIKTPRLIIIRLIKVYQSMVSPFFVSSCRHMPTCSDYAVEAIREFGILKGIYISLRRIIACRPGGTSGYDPVPKKDK